MRVRDPGPKLFGQKQPAFVPPHPLYNIYIYAQDYSRGRALERVFFFLLSSKVCIRKEQFYCCCCKIALLLLPYYHHYYC